jgi:hypothetical protein
MDCKARNSSASRFDDRSLVAALLTKIVILGHRVSPSASPMTGSSGVSSTPQLFDSITCASDYWIARRSLSSGGAPRRRGWRAMTVGGWRGRDRPCERSDAIHSQEKRMDCFVASLHAMTALQFRIRLHDPATRSARAVHLSLAPGGRGECRAPTAPAASCALCIGRTHTSNNEYTGTPDIPARNGFNGLCRALPGDRALLPPLSADMVLSKPGRADATPQNLTPASGRQDHMILPSAATSLVRPLSDRSRIQRTRPATFRAQNAAASTASHPASLTIMIRPSGGVGWPKC